MRTTFVDPLSCLAVLQQLHLFRLEVDATAFATMHATTTDTTTGGVRTAETADKDGYCDHDDNRADSERRQLVSEDLDSENRARIWCGNRSHAPDPSRISEHAFSAVVVFRNVIETTGSHFGDTGNTIGENALDTGFQGHRRRCATNARTRQLDFHLAGGFVDTDETDVSPVHLDEGTNLLDGLGNSGMHVLGVGGSFGGGYGISHFRNPFSHEPNS
jgi:hypothetical protein